MYYRCRTCGHEEYRGCLPSVSCGLLISAELGIAIGLMPPLLWRLFPQGLGWWWLIMAPLGIVLGIPVGAAIHYLLQSIEHAAAAFRRCPACRARRWSWGYTKGFGL